MTIKQQGGIFGRNPTFNDLTVEGTLNSTGSMTVDELGIGTSTVTWPLTLEVDNTSWVSRLYNTRTDADAAGLLVRSDSTSAANATILGLYADGGYKFKFTANGNMVVGTAGGGIDFSATSGTGTSELFDDYEEGTWTPTLQSATTTTYNNNSGVYTKVGNLVFISANLDINSVGDGDTNSIVGLPFSASSSNTYSAVIGFVRSADAGFYSMTGRIDANQSRIDIDIQTGLDGNYAAGNVFKDSTRVNLSVVYQT